MSEEFTLDMLDIPSSWRRGEGDWTGVAAALARGETVEVIQEVGCTLWRNSLPEKHSLYWDGEIYQLSKPEFGLVSRREDFRKNLLGQRFSGIRECCG